ncbi:MAG TPA: DUF885 domain-containing protein [Usitatibacter sp.]|nr:DUF885 domain-containing protein [Usitatibacter sp.]
MRRAALALVAALAIPAAAAEPPRDAKLHALFEREFMWAVEQYPESGTFLGLPGYDDKVTDFSPQAIAVRKARVKRLMADLGRFDPKRLNTQDRISRDLMLHNLAMMEEENALYGDLPFGTGPDGWMQVSSMHGPQNFLTQLVQSTRFAAPVDYENYLKRLDKVPRALDQMMELMRAGLRSGWVPPRDAMSKVPAMFTVFAGTDVTASPLWQPFADYPAAIPAADRERFTAAGRTTLSAKVHPAFAKWKRFLEEEYLPGCARELAASKLPAGERYYAHLVREQTTTNLAPERIHEIGLAEVKRIRAEMDAVIAKTGFKGTFAEFLHFIRTDPRFFFKTGEERLRAYRDLAKRADAELPKLFAELPRVPYGVRAMKEFEGDNSDHYSSPALDGSRSGYFEANVNNLQNRPSHEMEATLLHEAVPGHHLQTARSLELTGLPKFRRSSWYGAYGEGWALYAESLGFDMGFYTDPYSHFGRLSAEMLRACRLVIDTGLHAKGWTRAQSIAYLAENSGVAKDYAEAEIDRYIVWAGQALSYKIGEMKIRELREKARGALGARFDIRRFHNAVLDDGAVPLTVLEARIDEWIAAEKGRKS